MLKYLKKISLVSFVLLAFSACGLEDAFKDDAETTDITGVIMEQEISDTRPGTHIVVLDSGDEIAIRSLAFNLYDSEYTGNKVKIMGVMSDDEEVFEVTGISVVDVLSEDVDEGEWENYKNTDHGFEIKHLSNWEVVEAADGSVVFENELGSLSVSQQPFHFDAMMDEEGNEIKPLEAYFQDNFSDGSGAEMKKIGPDQLEAIADGSDYYLYRNGLIYLIDISAADDESALIFKDMVSSFKFLGFTVGDGNGEGMELEDDESPVEEAGDDSALPEIDYELTYFESLPYEFSAPYPASWYYAGERSDDPSVLHHYGLSDEYLEDGNEVLSLDVYSGSIPSGKTMIVDGKSIVVIDSGSAYTAYVTVEDQSYRISGPSSHSDLILNMAAGIEHIEVPEEE